MTQILTTLIRRWRYGSAVTVVSGLPRSGTSMLMKMLEAGGHPIMTDHVRTADDDNPKGYFELERAKNLAKETDKAWLRDTRGKAVKVISYLLKELPDNNFYRVILSQRDLSEVIASQNIMLERRAEANPISDDRAVELYQKHLIQTKLFTACKSNFDLLELNYHEVLKDPQACAIQINRFLDGRLDTEKMARAVDHNLYRNRGQFLETPPDSSGNIPPSNLSPV